MWERDWRDLPEGVIGDISKLLSLVDNIHFRRVCRAWRSALAGYPTSTHTPWLMVKSLKDPGSGSIQFLDILSGKMCKMVGKGEGEGGGGHKHKRKGTGGGGGLHKKKTKFHLDARGSRWLVTLFFSEYLEQTIVWDPMNMNKQHLFPSIATLPGFPYFRNSGELFGALAARPGRGFRIKIRPSSHGDDDDMMMAVAIYGEFQNSLGYAMAGDIRWTLVDESSILLPYEDAVMYHGHVYGVLPFGEVNCWGDVMEARGRPPLLSSESVKLPAEFMESNIRHRWFLTAGSRLLMLWTTLTHGHVVFELNCQTNVWSPTNSLGGGAIFIGDHISGPLLVDHHPTRPDRIFSCVLRLSRTRLTVTEISQSYNLVRQEYDHDDYDYFWPHHSLPPETHGLGWYTPTL